MPINLLCKCERLSSCLPAVSGSFLDPSCDVLLTWTLQSCFHSCCGTRVLHSLDSILLHIAVAENQRLKVAKITDVSVHLGMVVSESWSWMVPLNPHHMCTESCVMAPCHCEKGQSRGAHSLACATSLHRAPGFETFFCRAQTRPLCSQPSL